MSNMEHEDPHKRYLNLTRHRAVITLNEQEVGTLLGLPKDVAVRAINWNNRTWQLEVCIYGLRFDRVEEACEAPIIQKELTFVECDQGLVHIKTNFPDYPNEVNDA